MAGEDKPETTKVGLLLEILVPSAANPAPVAPNGTTTVTVLAGQTLGDHKKVPEAAVPGAVEVWAAVVRPQDSFDPIPPPTAVLLPPSGPVAQYSGPVRVVSATLNGGDDDNKVVVWLKVNGMVVRMASLDFVGRAPDQVTLTVSGKCCIYLTGVTDFSTTPNGEDATCLPVALAVPPDAVNVVVTADGNWGCSGVAEEQSGPAGLNEAPVDVDAGYASLSPLVSIANLSLPRNTLVAVFAPAPPQMPPANTDETSLGDDSGEIGVTEGSLALFLGLHDQSDWTNNQGNVTATVTWS
jgi:hypothetical protein